MLASWHGFFAWYGWSALVAIGTLALSAGTVWLGVQAKKQVDGEWAREWAAQRPEVYPLMTHEWVRGTGLYDRRRRNLLPLKNGGRGPALNVHGEITAVSSDGREYKRKILAGTIAPGDVLDGRTAPDEVEVWRTVRGVLRYRDLVEGAYETHFEFSEAEGGELFLEVQPTVHRPSAAA
jgi:hypothetical protein